jgi:DNA-directed RNA polymerase specialized sigma24 family protein
MLKWKKAATEIPTQYATRTDFCQVFRNEVNSLYLLSLLLTADYAKAEKCFVRGLGDSIESTTVFKQWARSWARRVIIDNAIRLNSPRPNGQKFDSNTRVDGGPEMRAAFDAVIALPTFERFVFVMSVLERHSLQECSLRLNCTRQEVTTARIRAFERIANSMGFGHVDLSVTSGESAKSWTGSGSLVSVGAEWKI